MIGRPRRKGGDWESGEEWVGGFGEKGERRERDLCSGIWGEREPKSDTWRERVREPLGCVHLNT